MKILIDLNVVLDVVQHRQPHYAFSVAVLNEVLHHRARGFLPGHAVTTIYYLTHKFAGRQQAEKVVDWMLAHFDILAPGKDDFVRARRVAMTDYEDAVSAVLAEREGCDYIVTRNVADFGGAPVPALAPQDFLGL